MTNVDNKFESKYLNMLGLQYTPIIKSDDYIGVVSRNDFIIGYSKKQKESIKVDLEYIDIRNDCLYKKIEFKRLKDKNVIEGTITTLCSDGDVKINYTMDEREATHKLELLNQDNTFQLNFSEESIAAVYKETYYECDINNINGQMKKDKEVIMSVSSYFHSVLPDLLTNILNKYRKFDSYIISEISDQFREQDKIKQLII